MSPYSSLQLRLIDSVGRKDIAFDFCICGLSQYDPDSSKPRIMWITLVKLSRSQRKTRQHRSGRSCGGIVTGMGKRGEKMGESSSNQSVVRICLKLSMNRLNKR